MDKALLIPIVAMAIPLVVAPTAIIMRHLGRKREMEHRERMKALEMGLPVPGGNGWAALVCIAIGAGVPIAMAFFGLIALTIHVNDDVLVFPASVGLAGVISGTILAGKLLVPKARPADAPPYPKHSEYDPDAFDVVGRRG